MLSVSLPAVNVEHVDKDKGGVLGWWWWWGFGVTVSGSWSAHTVELPGPLRVF